ncbi:putative adenine-specific DNA methyl-transferase [Campylobacter phage F356]|uniref:Putative adenine-specific DNA methyl-transferase n=2 Tax=Fletchervirus CPX TaxID=1110702 RepID=A0A7T3N2E3_9CAUD|nr:putative adenine-specific DNA methyl-transferase [Campylobacter phage F355]QPX63768.1 putative adenine-specific DNA methyl-transferase [Campylobacter phage F356]
MKSYNNAFDLKDEYYTPLILIEFLIPCLYEKNIIKILCPFDDESSNYVKVFKHYGFDILISNPPFSKKNEIIRLLTQENIDFILLMNLMSINYQDFSETLRLVNLRKPINFIIPNKKVSFDGNTSSFSSGYIFVIV